MPGLQVINEIGSGPQVFEALEKDSIDLLLIDVTMPEFEPISAIGKIRLKYPELKILVVSAYDDKVYVKGLLGAGVNGYHLKEESLNDLKLAIERVLEGERWISSSLINKLVQTPEEPESLPDLTNRQLGLLRLLQQGCDNKTIAQEMGLSVKTVENHLTRLYRKLDVQSRLEAVSLVIRYPQVLGIPGQKAAGSGPEEMISFAKSTTILVLDDNARYRKHLLRMIGKANPRATIYEAGSIEEGVNLARSINFQLALIDMILKDEDGITCARRLSAINPRTRIILISAYPDREFHRQGLESGAAAFLDKKNLDLPTLKQVINDVVI